MRKNIIKEMRNIVDVQGLDGNWDYDPYLHGMYNGMEFMLSIAERREPIFKDPPEVWGCDKNKNPIHITCR